MDSGAGQAVLGEGSVVVRRLRRLTRLSQREFAVLAGTSGPTIAAYETGAKEPRLSTLARAASAAGWRLEVRLTPEDVGARQRRRRQRRSLAVGAAVAAAAEADFGAALRIGRANLTRMVGDTRAGQSERLIDAWAQALAQGPDRVREVLLDPSDAGHDMRQMSPLAGLISDAERIAALAAADALEDQDRQWT